MIYAYWNENRQAWCAQGQPARRTRAQSFLGRIPPWYSHWTGIFFRQHCLWHQGGIRRLTPFQAVLISLTNLTSAGQFAGITVIAAGASLLEMALTQLVVNLRYALMSLSLSRSSMHPWGTLKRCVIAFGNTDEIFAVASSQRGSLGLRYMLGLMTAPIFGWSLGTLTGAVADTLFAGYCPQRFGNRSLRHVLLPLWCLL